MNLTKTDQLMLKFAYGCLVFMCCFMTISVSGAIAGWILLSVPSLYFTFWAKRLELGKPSKAHWFLILFYLSALVSTFINWGVYENPARGLGKLNYILQGIFFIYTLKALVKYHYTNERVARIIHIIAITCAIETIVGIICKVTNYDIVRGHPRNFGGRIIGIRGILFYGYEMPYYNLLLWGILLYRDQIKAINTKLILFCVSLSTFGLLYSDTRGGILAFFAALPFIFYGKNKKLFMKVTVAIALLGGIMLTLVLTGVVKHRVFQKLDSPSNRGRVMMWQKSIEAFKDKPFLGHGNLAIMPQYYFKVYRDDGSMYREGRLEDSHNTYLQILSNLGVIGLILFLCFLGLWILKDLKLETFTRNLTLPCVISFAFQSLVHSSFTTGVTTAILLLFLFSLSNLSDNIKA